MRREEKSCSKSWELSGLDSWTEGNKERALNLLAKYHDIFTLEDREMGFTEVAKHKIEVTDPKPFKERPRNIPSGLLEEMKDHPDHMLDVGAIKPSKLAWSNVVVLVWKKDGGLRFCVNFQRLNTQTQKDAFPLPRIHDAIDALSGSKYYTTVDLLSGFWQTPMEESSKQYTAFTEGILGFFQCECMPFGLFNAPATFQRLMTNCLGELNYSTCSVYLDDVTYSSTQEEHIKCLQAVLKCFRLHRLKPKPLKCEFFKEKIEYLGHSVSSKGVWPSRDNLKAIAKYPEPMMYTAIKGFIRLMGHYRRFIKDFAKITDPLHEYVRGDTAKKKRGWVVLNEAARGAFHKLKKAVMSAPVLAYPDPNKEYLLKTNASKLGLGAVLSQKQSDGRYHLVAFRSMALHRAKVNYHSTKLQFLAMKWSIKYFQTYLLGHHFKVHMDNNPLMYSLTSPNTDTMKQRWINELVKYDFSLKYQKGKNNTVADALSRISEECFLDEEAEKVLEAVPVIPGDDTIFEVLEEKEEDQQPEKAAPPPHTMSSEAMKAIFDNLTSGAGRRAELECSVDSAAHHKANSIKVSVKSMRLNRQIHVTDWAEA